MNHYAEGITALEQELAEIDRKRPLIVRALEGLRELAGDVAPRRAKKSGQRGETNKQTNKQSKARASAAPRSLPDGGRGAIAQARDAAIKAALKTGPKLPSQLLAVLPNEPGQTGEQRDTACRNALSRMRMRKEIKSVDDGWVLV